MRTLSSVGQVVRRDYSREVLNYAKRLSSKHKSIAERTYHVFRFKSRQPGNQIDSRAQRYIKALDSELNPNLQNLGMSMFCTAWRMLSRLTGFGARFLQFQHSGS